MKKNKKKSKIYSSLSDFLIIAFLLFIVGFIVVYFYNENYKFNIIENELELKMKENYNINVIAKNPNNYDINNYTFTSSNENIATVDKLGNITPINEGTVEIIIKSKK